MERRSPVAERRRGGKRPGRADGVDDQVKVAAWLRQHDVTVLPPKFAEGVGGYHILRAETSIPEGSSNASPEQRLALAKLITLNKKLQQVEGRLILCNIDPQIKEVFEITKLNRLFTIHDEEQAALQAF